MPVIDAIQGDGFNPLWQQVLIHVQRGIYASPVRSLKRTSWPLRLQREITLAETDEIYRCSVVGPK